MNDSDLFSKNSIPTPNKGSELPNHICAVAALTTLAITMGVKVRSEKSRKITSIVKKIAARGALNTAASPAADPHPSSVAALAPSPFSQREILLPTVAPIVTIGPSGPALPPEPIVHVLANQCRIPKRIGKLDCSRFTANMTRVTPCPRKFVGKIQNTHAVSSAPTQGATSKRM